MRVLIDDCGIDCSYRGKTSPRYADALIAPDGTFYSVGAVGHDHAASAHGMTEVDVLEKEGWIHFSLAYQYRPVVNFATLRPTQSQLDTLFDIIVSMGKGESIDSNATVEWMSFHAQVINRIIKEGRDW